LIITPLSEDRRLLEAQCRRLEAGGITALLLMALLRKTADALANAGKSVRGVKLKRDTWGMLSLTLVVLATLGGDRLSVS
jgi:hypothetical protein